MTFILYLCIASAICSGLLLACSAIAARPRPRNRKRPPADLDLTRLLRSCHQQPLVDPQTERRVKPLLFRSLRPHFEAKTNGHHQHERNKLP